MTSLGGFSFEITASTDAAQRAMDELLQKAQQLGPKLQQALGGGSGGGTFRPKIDTSEVERGAERIARVTKQITDRPTTFTIRANFKEAQDGLDKLAAQARELGTARFNFRVNADGTKEAQEGLGRLTAQLKNAKAGDVINLDVRGDSAKRAADLMEKLTADINAAKAAGARVAVNVQTNAQQAGFASQLGSGFVQQVTPGLSTAPGVAAGVVAAQAFQATAAAIKDATAAGIAYNAMLETAGVQFKVFTGSAELADEALVRLRRYADITPFNTEEVIRSGAVFARVTGGNIERMERMVQLAGQLATINPHREQGGGLEGATIALTEAQGGDFTSIEKRFNVRRDQIAAIKEAGLSGVALAEALAKAAGGSDTLVAALGDTFEGRLATAKSHLAELGGAATKPIFGPLSDGLALFNRSYDQSAPRFQALADFLGKLSPQLVANALLPPEAAVIVGGVGSALTGLGTPPPPPAASGLSPQAQAQQAAIEGGQKEIDAATAAVTKQETKVKDLQKELERVQLRAKEITAEYERQLRPLEEQQRTLAGRQRENDAQQRAIADRVVAAGPSTDARAEAARATVLNDHNQELVEIGHKRAELAEQVSRAEEAAAERGIEAQIRGQERALQATQQAAQLANQARQEAIEGAREEAQAHQQARQDALDGLREEVRGRQEARQVALDGLRDLIAAQQEQRRDALEGIQDEIRARRQQYDDARQARQDANRDTQEAFQEETRLEDRGHQSLMQHYSDRLDALREQGQEIERQSRAKSAAERELAAFDASQRAIGRQQQLEDARRAVAGARTGRELRAAGLAFQRTTAGVAADVHREELQARITKEKEEADQRRGRIADKINKIEREQRADDRKYQEIKEQREDQFREQQRAQQLADRAAEQTERELRRQEDDRVRALQRADHDADKAAQKELRDQQIIDREADKADQAIIRAQEQADREADRKEQAAIRAQEKVDREADRAAQREILGLQQGIQAARNNLADRKDAFEGGLDDAALGRLKESIPFEQVRLDIRTELLRRTDALALADAARDKVFTDEAGRILATQIAANDAKTAAANERQRAALGTNAALAVDLEIQIGRGKAEVEALKKQVDQATKDLDRIKELTGPKPGEEAVAAAEQRTNDLGAGRTTSIGGASGVGGGAAPAGLWAGRGDPFTGMFDSSVAGGPGEFLIAANKLAANFWKAFTDALKGAGNTAAGLGATDAFAAELDGAVEGQTPSATATNAVGDMLTKMLNDGWAQAAPTADAIPTEIAAHIDGALPTALGDTATAFGAALAKAAQDGWALAVPTVDAIPPEVGSHLTTGIDTGLTDFGAAFGAALSTAMQSGWETAAAEVDAINTEVALRFGGTDDIDLPARLKATAPTIGKAISDAFDQAWAQGGSAGVDAVLTEVSNHVADTSKYIDTAANKSAIQNAIERLFGPDVLGPAFKYAEQEFRTYGNNSAVKFIDGWNGQMEKWQPYVPAASGGGGAASGSASSGGSTSVLDNSGRSSYGPYLTPGPQDIQNYLVNVLGWKTGDPGYGLEYSRFKDQIDAGYTPPPDMSITGRRWGGSFEQGRPYLLHQDEIMVPRASGEVLPPEFLSGVKAMAGRAGPASGAVATGGGGAPQVHISIADGAFRVTSSGQWGGVDRAAVEAMLSEHGTAIMDDFVDILHASRKHAPRRSDRDLGGAR